MEESLNLLGDYIFRRIQKDQSDNRMSRYRPRESLSGLYISSKDIQRYIWDYYNLGIDHMGDDECAEDRIERYWDDSDGAEN